MTGLRQRKRERTRRAIVDAATALFERHGYDGTTVADIAAEAEIGTRTFFGYFASKEDVLLPEVDARVAAAVAAINARGARDRPADVLVRALRDVAEGGHDMVGRRAALLTRLMREVPALRGRALQVQLDAQREIARHLAAAFPQELDDVAAGALVGAFIGAVTGAMQALTDRDTALTKDERRSALTEATDRALRPWMH
ncbi:MAG: TetR/AcrR family transcriptional regulator [Pseudonocardia sp.]|nr:TetR/AcrR family transcriptional regulator [Pseudonocardia sp.]